MDRRKILLKKEPLTVHRRINMKNQIANKNRQKNMDTQRNLDFDLTPEPKVQKDASDKKKKLLAWRTERNRVKFQEYLEHKSPFITVVPVGRIIEKEVKFDMNILDQTPIREKMFSERNLKKSTIKNLLKTTEKSKSTVKQYPLTTGKKQKPVTTIKKRETEPEVRVTRKTARKTLFKESEEKVQKENLFVFGNSRKAEKPKEKKVLATRLENSPETAPMREKPATRKPAREAQQSKEAQKSQEIVTNPEIGPIKGIMKKTVKEVDQKPKEKPALRKQKAVFSQDEPVMEAGAGTSQESESKTSKEAENQSEKEPAKEPARELVKRNSKESIKVPEKKSKKSPEPPKIPAKDPVNDTTVMEPANQTYNFKFTVNNIKASQTKIFKLYKSSLDTQLKFLKKPVDSWTPKFQDIEKYCGQQGLLTVQETHEEIRKISEKLKNFELTLKPFEFEEASEETTDGIKSSWFEIFGEIKNVKAKIELAKEIVENADKLKAVELEKQKSLCNEEAGCSTPRRSVRIMQKNGLKNCFGCTPLSASRVNTPSKRSSTKKSVLILDSSMGTPKTGRRETRKFQKTPKPRVCLLDDELE